MSDKHESYYEFTTCMADGDSAFFEQHRVCANKDPSLCKICYEDIEDVKIINESYERRYGKKIYDCKHKCCCDRYPRQSIETMKGLIKNER